MGILEEYFWRCLRVIIEAFWKYFFSCNVFHDIACFCIQNLVNEDFLIEIIFSICIITILVDFENIFLTILRALIVDFSPIYIFRHTNFQSNQCNHIGFLKISTLTMENIIQDIQKYFRRTGPYSKEFLRDYNFFKDKRSYYYGFWKHFFFSINIMNFEYFSNELNVNGWNFACMCIFQVGRLSS